MPRCWCLCISSNVLSQVSSESSPSGKKFPVLGSSRLKIMKFAMRCLLLMELFEKLIFSKDQTCWIYFKVCEAKLPKPQFDRIRACFQIKYYPFKSWLEFWKLAKESSQARSLAQRDGWCLTSLICKASSNILICSLAFFSSVSLFSRRLSQTAFLHLHFGCKG